MDEPQSSIPFAMALLFHCLHLQEIVVYDKQALGEKVYSLSLRKVATSYTNILTYLGIYVIGTTTVIDSVHHIFRILWFNRYFPVSYIYIVLICVVLRRQVLLRPGKLELTKVKWMRSWFTFIRVLDYWNPCKYPQFSEEVSSYLSLWLLCLSIYISLMLLLKTLAPSWTAQSTRMPFIWKEIRSIHHHQRDERSSLVFDRKKRTLISSARVTYVEHSHLMGQRGKMHQLARRNQNPRVIGPSSEKLTREEVFWLGKSKLKNLGRLHHHISLVEAYRKGILHRMTGRKTYRVLRHLILQHRQDVESLTRTYFSRSRYLLSCIAVSCDLANPNPIHPTSGLFHQPTGLSRARIKVSWLSSLSYESKTQGFNCTQDAFALSFTDHLR